MTTDHPRGRSRYASVLAFLLLIPFVMGAGQAAGPELGIGPSRLEIVSVDGRLTEPVTVSNLGDVPLFVTLDTRTLGHDLEGGPLFPERIADDRLIAARGTVTLAPGESRQYAMTAAVPSGEPALYAAFVATAQPPDAGGLVRSQLQVASLVLLTRDGEWERAVEVEAVELEPATDERGGRVLAVVRNTGEVHVRPSGSMTFSQNGRELGEVELEPEVVIPGYARALQAFWSPPAGVEGPVEVVVTLDDPVDDFRGTVEVSDPVEFQPIVDGMRQLPQVAAGDEERDGGRVRALGVALALLLLSVAMIVAYWRSRRGHDDHTGETQAVTVDHR